jgi:uncharacterized membrane protein YsdA (DUF1294 family)
MRFSKLYIIAVFFGLIGAVAGAFAGGFIAAARCEGGLECLGAAFLGVGLGAIVAESCAMALAAHKANHNRGNLLLTFLSTLLLAVPIPFALLARLHRAFGVAAVPASGVGLREDTASYRDKKKGGPTNSVWLQIIR